MSEISIYKTSDGKTEVEVRLEEETVWLSQAQLVDLFQSSKANISEHIKAIFISEELKAESTVRNFRTVRTEGKRKVTREIEHYNLDVIISVGFRVNSRRGIQFRQWANQRIKDYLVRGYALNQKRLEQLQQTIQLISRSSSAENMQLQEARGVLEIISLYTQSFILLNRFDSHSLNPEGLNAHITYEIKYDEAREAIGELKKQLIFNKEATELFGKEKDDGFQSSLKSVVQTFDGQYLYPSIEEQAAHLLYFVIKNHSFNDGNKRIGAFLFVWFLEKNKHRFKANGEVKINDNGLTTMALLVAQSKPEEKDLMIQLIISLIANHDRAEVT